ncbi:MAG: ATP-grasp domain-containing protein [Actinobacteria bacterium]|nr:ATP-grasp domain-containing protein [Actinomycetota bacterium]
MKLLVVEAQQYGRYYLPRYHLAQQYGADLHLLLGIGEPDYLPGRTRLVGSAGIEELVAAARDWHAAENFDGVFTFAEMSVNATALIAAALGLPGISAEAARCTRNKLLMREAHQRGGVPIPRFRFVPDLAAAQAAAEEFGYPVILKPTLGAASYFVFKVNDPGQLAERFAQASEGIDLMAPFTLEASGIDIGPQGLLVEEFLDGDEHLYEALAWDGELYLGSAVDRVTMEGETFDDDVHIAPTTLSDAQLAEVREVISAAASSLGLHRSALHAEIRMHRGRPHLVEIAARLGGGALDMVARVTAGYCPVRAVLDVARGVRPEIGHYRPTGVHMMGTCLICDAGQLEYVTVPPEVSESEHTLMARITQEPGAVIRRPPDGNSILGFLVVTGDSHPATKERLEDFVDRIEVKLAGRPVGRSKTPWARSRPVATTR